MLRQKMRDVPTEMRWLSMSDHDFALDDAVGVELAFNTNRFVR